MLTIEIPVQIQAERLADITKVNSWITKVVKICK